VLIAAYTKPDESLYQSAKAYAGRDTGPPASGLARLFIPPAVFSCQLEQLSETGMEFHDTWQAKLLFDSPLIADTYRQQQKHFHGAERKAGKIQMDGFPCTSITLVSSGVRHHSFLELKREMEASRN
jgi:hypothetical protein